jgi:REP element-mobilizing transposase RayT
MPHWDYSGNGIYFITIVTQGRICNLGEIIRGKMILSDFGKIVNTEWLKSFEIRDELVVDEYIIMPNHLHALVILNKYEHLGAYEPPAIWYRKPKSISSFVAGFKSAVNCRIDDYIDELNLSIPKYNRENHFFQPNYHDHIVRNQDAFIRIKKYIADNPKRWRNDKFNPL